MAVAVVSLVLIAGGLIALQRLDPGGSPRGEPAADLAAGSVLQLRQDSPGSPVRSLEVPLGAGSSAVPLQRSAAGAVSSEMSTTRFSMLGLTWRGRGTPVIVVRTHRIGGGWSGWRRAPEMEDRPAHEGDPSLRATDAMWVGASDGVRVRVKKGRAKQLQLTLIDPGTLPSDRTATPERRSTRPTRAPEPHLYSRKAWGADPTWRNGTGRYIRKIRQVHIHHTATPNNYAPEDVPALLRGMYRYHTKTLGWFDIAYNFLIDRFGRIWVGRSGGATKPVRGAHTLGFNHESVGVAVIGRFGRQAPPRQAIRAIVRLAAWKLDAYGGHPRGTVVVRSQGSDRYPTGTRVRLPVIDGHRDTNETSCPGQRLYNLLPEIRRRAAKRVHRYDP
ncbi:peptidoglycan recognition protein [Nocardioides sp. Kera G14]|uniref:peptidoglycan recognition protein family protein n=1 Tax=Nocardioides sp. Kera G14 TaxID=2884264 RepID=UPI001D0F77A9|nr:peptidoglycan recognition protein [Nocardioides sp. Kera G14]UDY24476.1 peptidoglycan recognition protein [Nocardioides sp. Kera G14]